jgi:D-alanyl-D-alanine carboxypeptidase
MTPAAGPCLVTSVAHSGMLVIVTVLAAKTHKSRFNDACKLSMWAINRMKKLIAHFGPDAPSKKKNTNS